VVRYAGLLFLFLLVYALMVRPLQKRVLATSNPLLAASQIPVQLEPDAASLPESAASVAQRSLILKKQLTEFVQAEPETSTTAVRAWLREEAR
jgi:flagellar biosynthesis/type III secretory pathway M-ring protein FliF/YscJ